jgi:hypothetical protein
MQDARGSTAAPTRTDRTVLQEDEAADIGGRDICTREEMSGVGNAQIVLDEQ